MPLLTISVPLLNFQCHYWTFSAITDHFSAITGSLNTATDFYSAITDIFNAITDPFSTITDSLNAITDPSGWAPVKLYNRSQNMLLSLIISFNCF